MGKQRLAYLDGLRGLAAILVIIHHLMVGFYPATYTRTADIHTSAQIEWLLHDTPLGIVINGGLAVAVFLLLSGYFVALQVSNRSDVKSIITSVIKRFLRFFLLIFVCNLIAWGVIMLGQTWNHQAALLTGSWWWLGAQWQLSPSLFTALTQSWWSLFRIFPIGEYYNSSLWTMPFFFVGSLLATSLGVFTNGLRRRWIIYGITIFMLIGNYYYLLILGMLLFEVQKRLEGHQLHPAVICILVGITLYFGGYPQAFASSVYSGWYQWLPVFSFLQTSSLYHGIAASSLLLLVLNSKKLQFILSRNACIYLGERSFSLYVVHVIAINSLTSFLFVYFYHILPYSMAFGVSVLLTIPVILVVSEGMYRWVELQSIGISNHILHRLLGYNTFYGSSSK